MGAPLYKINSLSIKEELSRLKSVIRNDDAEALTEFERELRNNLEELERSYRSKDSL
jgi:hypothetical protein